VGRERRIELIRQIEELRGSSVIVYVTGDRNPVPTSIAEDAVRLLYEHLLAMEADPERRAD
jgi:hypothetical protein